MTSMTAIVGLLLFGLVVAALYSSVTIVEQGELKAVLVFGKMQGVLVPGLNFVPPFVSKTYPIDPQTMQIVKAGSNADVPDEFEADVRDAR